MSIPVAGSAPLFYRNADPNSVGDLEQNYAPLFSEDIAADGSGGGGVATWQEIYALGGYGSGRKQIMVINEFDPCCFSGTFANSFKEIVQNKVVNELQSGSWDYVLDSSSIVHAISSFAITEIIDPALSYFYDNIDKNQIPEPNSLSISSIGLFILIALLKGKTNKSLALNNYNVEFNIQTTYIKKIINVFLVRISHIINLYENI